MNLKDLPLWFWLKILTEYDIWYYPTCSDRSKSYFKSLICNYTLCKEIYYNIIHIKEKVYLSKSPISFLPNTPMIFSIPYLDSNITCYNIVNIVKSLIKQFSSNGLFNLTTSYESKHINKQFQLSWFIDISKYFKYYLRFDTNNKNYIGILKFEHELRKMADRLQILNICNIKLTDKCFELFKELIPKMKNLTHVYSVSWSDREYCKSLRDIFMKNNIEVRLYFVLEEELSDEELLEEEPTDEIYWRKAFYDQYDIGYTSELWSLKRMNKKHYTGPIFNEDYYIYTILNADYILNLPDNHNHFYRFLNHDQRFIDFVS